MIISVQRFMLVTIPKTITFEKILYKNFFDLTFANVSIGPVFSVTEFLEVGALEHLTTNAENNTTNKHLHTKAQSQLHTFSLLEHSLSKFR